MQTMQRVCQIRKSRKQTLFWCWFCLTVELSFQFPSLKTLGEDLVTVLDFLHVKYVIGLGEGAGANVLARFGIAHPTRSLGLILINATGSAASVTETFKTKVLVSVLMQTKFVNETVFLHLQFINWKGDEVASSAESFLVFHKFGHVSILQSVCIRINRHTLRTFGYYARTEGSSQNVAKCYRWEGGLQCNAQWRVRGGSVYTFIT